MAKMNVSVVSYGNSIPFAYGLMHSEIWKDINLSLDIPATCADKVLSGIADIGLIPVAETLRLKEYEIVSDLCIGASDFVKTVILASNCPVNEIKEVYLDYQSRTSVVLVKVLAKMLWKIQPTWIPASVGFESTSIKGNTAAVIIGDRTFTVKSNYRYDLAHEWKTLTGLPFVFAAWIANKKVDDIFKTRFNKALEFGIQNIEASVDYFKDNLTPNVDFVDYLRNNIDYQLNEPKRKAMNLFLDYAREFICEESDQPIHNT